MIVVDPSDIEIYSVVQGDMKTTNRHSPRKKIGFGGFNLKQDLFSTGIKKCGTCVGKISHTFPLAPEKSY